MGECLLTTWYLDMGRIPAERAQVLSVCVCVSACASVSVCLSQLAMLENVTLNEWIMFLVLSYLFFFF